MTIFMCKTDINMKVLFLFLISIWPNRADIYLHNPRGSNNRLDESGRGRNNANRLFDSQNNNRGGYNVGSVYYYAGSKVSIEWTNQHSCGSSNNHCEITIQYMCGDNVRDGSTTTTIPDNAMNCENYDCTTDTRYGMHEDYEYYTNCKLRQRNTGLYLANQGPHGKSAKYTRQNPGGNRRGYECPEERDYYPYWHPTPWKDIVVMTNDASRCPYYQEESENVKGRWACSIPWYTMMKGSYKGLRIPNTKEECEAFRWPAKSQNGTRGEWIQFPSHGLPAPDCHENEFSRDNHLGNGVGGYPNVYNWTVPDTIHERCVMRVRYNISTGDYDAWDAVNATHNDREQKTRLDLSEKYGFNTRADAEKRGFRLKNNPEIQIFPELEKLNFRLAINTAQYGRTFQDRTHTFAIRPRPSHLDAGTIYNVNVRGKRGNIVQVYPAVEYDFVPNTLKLTPNDYVHFQWTGSNTNPHNNDGQGRAGTDRSNVVLQRLQYYPEGNPGGAAMAADKYGHWGRSYPEFVRNTTFIGLTEKDLMDLALLTSQQFRGEMSELDDAGTYFDLGPRKVTRGGTYHYMCTRNNNFSNRSQKGRIICSEAKIEFKSIGWNGGNVAVEKGDRRVEVKVKKGVFSKLHKIQLEQWEPQQVEEMIKEQNKKNPVEGTYASAVTVIHPEGRLTEEGETFEVEMSVDSSDVTVYRTSSEFATWSKVEAQVEGSVVKFSAEEGGVYVAVGHNSVGLIVGIVVAVLVLIAVLIGGTVFYFKRHPDKASTFMRSFQQKV